MIVSSERANLNKCSKFQYHMIGSFLATDMFLVKTFFSGALVQPTSFIYSTACHACLLVYFHEQGSQRNEQMSMSS